MRSVTGSWARPRAPDSRLQAGAIADSKVRVVIAARVEDMLLAGLEIDRHEMP
jgi:hypothetical protein